MCAIAGFYAFGNKKPDIKMVKELLIASESRGKDATGYAFVQQDRLIVRKEPVAASEFVKYLDWIDLPKIMIMHCRQATQGNPKERVNNHPIFSKSGLAVVHNGVIWNDNELFEKFRFRRDGQVDSEIILKIIENSGSFQNLKLLNEIEGGFSFAAIWTKFPTQLLLVKHDNPLAIAFDTDDDILYFGSSINILKTALPKKNYRGFLFLEQSRFLFHDLVNDTGLVINQEGLMRKFEINAKKHRYWRVGYYNKFEIEKACEFCGAPGEYLEDFDLFICKDCYELNKHYFEGYEEDFFKDENGMEE